MDELPLSVAVFYSIPESFLVCWLGLGLAGERIDLRKLGVIAVLAALVSYAVRRLPVPYGVHSFLHLGFLVLFILLLFKIPVWKSILAVLFGFMSLALVEMVNVPVFCRITGYNLADIVKDPWLRIAMGFPQLVVLGFAAWAVNRWGLRLVKTDSGDTGYESVASHWEQRKRHLLFSLIAIVSLQVVLVGFIRCREYLVNVFPLLPESVLADAMMLLLVLVVFISLRIVLKLLRLTQDIAQYHCEVENLRNMEALFSSMRAQRHDFLNHVQTLYGMLQLKCYREAEEYIREVFKETAALGDVIRTGHPGLAALFFVKGGAAAARGIEFSVSAQGDVSGLQIPSHELNRILGNLIDNAFDAAEMAEVSPRRVCVRVLKAGDSVIFEIENTGCLEPQIKRLAFLRGFSTKGGEHMGMGLSIVQELLKKHRGALWMDNTERGTVLSRVSIPCSG